MLQTRHFISSIVSLDCGNPSIRVHTGKPADKARESKVVIAGLGKRFHVVLTLPCIVRFEPGSVGSHCHVLFLRMDRAALLLRGPKTRAPLITPQITDPYGLPYLLLQRLEATQGSSAGTFRSLKPFCPFLPACCMESG
jgi:hypothetical protein